MELKESLENIPILLQYFIPGYISSKLFSFLTSKRIKDAQSRLIVSIVLSYTLISVTELLICVIIGVTNASILVKSGISIIIGIICSVGFAFLFQSKPFKQILKKIFHKTPNDIIWMDVLDLAKGSNLKLYEKNKDYYVIGHHHTNEERGDDSWFAITSYSKRRISDDSKLENHEDDEKAIFVVRLSELDHMEIFNPNEGQEK